MLSWVHSVFSVHAGPRLYPTESEHHRQQDSGMELWADVIVRVPRGTALTVRHGVGEITAADLAADLDLDICSGPVRVEGLDGDLRIDTGSGGIDLRLPPQASAQLTAETGSGTIHVDLPGVRLRWQERNEVAFHIGAGGARVVLDAGSGSIRIR